MEFRDLYSFLDTFVGHIKVFDFESSNLLYDSNKDGDLSDFDFDDCEVWQSFTEPDGCLVIQIIYWTAV